jgi:peptide chain release factor 2
MVTLDQIDDIKKRIADLKGFLSIQEKKEFIAAEELKTQAIDFWDKPKSAETHLKNINKKKGMGCCFSRGSKFF